MKVIIVAHNRQELLQLQMEALKLWGGVTKKDMIIIDNASEDGLRELLEGNPDMDYLICDEGIESFSSIINYTRNEFDIREDILLLNLCYMVLPSAIEEMQRLLHSDSKIGAVAPTVIPNGAEVAEDCITAFSYVQEGKMPIAADSIKMELPYGCVMIKNDMVEEVGAFEEKLFFPENVMWDFCTRGVETGWKLLECGSAFFYQLAVADDYEGEKHKKEADRCVLKSKWGMNYFNTQPNYKLLEFIDRQQTDMINVLEVGCDCGANLLWIKNKYPNANLYGMEINASAARIASYIANVCVGNIEKQQMDFGDVKFDYIIFGDVLEHLRDPEGVLRYCKGFLRDEGKILASIPNLMHFSVIRDLINGNFTYEDCGLLDRTHIHFFTYNEIMRMLDRTGMELIEVEPVIVFYNEMDKEYLQKLMELSDVANIEMFLAYQYLIEAKPV